MKAGKITAKLRDAVKVCFMVEGEEVKRYKNIEMPDALKELEIRDFAFNVLMDGKIEFWLHFDRGILPEEWPECRERRTRTPKVEAQAVEVTEAPAMPETVAEPVEAAEADAPEAHPVETAVATGEPATEPVEMVEATEPAAKPIESQEAEAEAAQAPEKKPAKRNRKPGKRPQAEPQQVDKAM